MKKSLFTKVLTVLGAAVLTLPAVLGMNSNTVKAADADDQNRTVILTKYGFSSIDKNEAPGTDDSTWKPEGSTPLEGVDFKVFDVTANYWSNPSEYAGSITIPNVAKVVAEGTTDENGQITKSLPKYSTDANGTKRLAVYLFRETDQRSGYGTAADFWLTLDKPAADGNVYVYPKNEQVETYQRHFKKIDGSTGEVLPGAKFVITNGTGNPHKYLQLTKKDGTPVTGPIKGFLDTLANNYRLTWISEKDEATVFVSDDNGIFGLNGFKNDGTYGYEEIEAPDGYELLTDPGSFTPEKDADQDVKNPEIIKNTPKGILPHTGGKGIVAFVVAGVALIALGGLAYSKRRAA